MIIKRCRVNIYLAFSVWTLVAIRNEVGWAGCSNFGFQASSRSYCCTNLNLTGLLYRIWEFALDRRGSYSRYFVIHGVVYTDLLNPSQTPNSGVEEITGMHPKLHRCHDLRPQIPLPALESTV